MWKPRRFQASLGRTRRPRTILRCAGGWTNSERRARPLTIVYNYAGHRRLTLFAREPRKQRQGSGDWEQATNRQQRRLTRAFDQWSAETRRQIESVTARGGSPGDRLAVFDAAIPALDAKLSEIIERGTRAAARIAAGDRAGTPEIEALIRDQIAESLDIMRGGLLQEVRRKIIPEIVGGGGTDRKALQDSFKVVRAGPGLLAGQFWVMIFATQKELGKTRDRQRALRGEAIEPVRWVLDPRAEHCKDSGDHLGCPGLAGEYPKGWDSLLTVPAGRTTCRGNCRCHLEAFIDGEWRRGLLDVL